MANNRPSTRNMKKNKVQMPHLMMLGFAASFGITGTPALSNINTTISSSTGIMANIPYKNDEYLQCLQIESKVQTQNIVENSDLNSYISASSDTDTCFEATGYDFVQIAFDQFVLDFVNEINRHSDYLTVSSGKAMHSFVNSARKIANIPFVKSSIDLLPHDGFKFVLKLSDSKILMASQYIVDSDIPSDNVVYSLFEDRKLVESNVVQIDRLIESFIV